MTSKQRYTYMVLRYVHDVVTGEFVNVGVVLHAPRSNTLKMGVRATIGRIKSIFPDLKRDAFLISMRAAERSMKRIAKEIADGDLVSKFEDAGAIARTVLAQDDSSLQWSPVAGGITDDVERTFDRVYARYVTRYDTKTEHRRTDNEVWRPVRDLLESRRVPVEFDEKVVVGKTDEIVFKHAWKNGVWHAYEPLSFDLADADGIKEKARRWRGHLEAVHDGVEDAVKLHLIVGAPQNTALLPAFANALQILEESAFKPQIFDEASIPVLVDQIEDEVREHSAPRQG